jgi:HEAT repeat protein
MGSRRAVPTLLGLMDDRAREVRAAAARSLGRLGAAEAVEPLVYAFAERRLPRSIAGQSLLAIGPAALERLRGLAGAEEPEARAFAVELVGFLGDASDDRLLVDRLRDTSAEVRARAARALGRLGAEEATAELTRALDDRISFVRGAAADALAVVGDRRAVPRLLALAREDEFDAAQAAARAAASLAPDAVVAAAGKPGAATHLLEAADLIAVRA